MCIRDSFLGEAGGVVKLASANFFVEAGGAFAPTPNVSFVEIEGVFKLALVFFFGNTGGVGVFRLAAAFFFVGFCDFFLGESFGFLSK